MLSPIVSFKTLFFFVDGLGIGDESPSANPLFRGDCPTLARWLREVATPIDATLDTPGLPQSATGQTTLFTGLNGARAHGGHKEGYPGPTLREVIESRNLFDLLQERGRTCTFANAYYLDGLSPAELQRRRSVTTVMTLKALGDIRRMAELERGEAVYNDLVRRRLRERGYPCELIAPSEAAAHLTALAECHDLTLFEYFMTDLIAHKGTAADMARVLGELDECPTALEAFSKTPGCLLLITSDHGNLEDAATRAHTRNPVPFIALGHGAVWLRERVKRLEDVTPALVALYDQG